jgi:Ca2+-binding EF-hand superfamily protein
MIRREAQFNQLDTNKDGNLSKKEVSAVKNRFARKLGQAFHRVDKDNNQLISGKEFQERSKRQFLKLDLNRDGTITEDELAKVSRNDSSRK